MTGTELEARYPWTAKRRGLAKQRAQVSLMQDYLHIGGDRMSSRQAAQRLGVSQRTVVRYRAVLRDLRGTP